MRIIFTFAAVGIFLECGLLSSVCLLSGVFSGQKIMYIHDSNCFCPYHVDGLAKDCSNSRAWRY